MRFNFHQHLIPKIDHFFEIWQNSRRTWILDFQIDLKCMHMTYRWKAMKLEISKTQISIKYSLVSRCLSVFMFFPSMSIVFCLSLLSDWKKHFCARINKMQTIQQIFVCMFDFDIIQHLFIQCEHLCHGLKAMMFCFKSIWQLPNSLQYIQLYHEIKTIAL